MARWYGAQDIDEDGDGYSRCTTDWGLISVAFSRADGTGVPVAAQHAIPSAFGAIGTQHGSSMTVLSTGVAAAPDHMQPRTPAARSERSRDDQRPARRLVQRALGRVSAGRAVPGDRDERRARPVMLTIAIRVPTNARAFTLNGYFLSGDYPESVCSQYNDYFLALLSSTYDGTPANPSDRNIAAFGNNLLGVGLARSNSGSSNNRARSNASACDDLVAVS
jgi:hypothetical protein